MTTDDALKACEDILREDKQYNIEHSILPGRNRIIDVMLSRRDELRDAYADIHQAFNGNAIGLQVFFDALLCCVDCWNPKAVAKSRNGRAELIALNQTIARAASTLADLLDQSTDLQEHSGFIADVDYDIMRTLTKAGETNSWFKYTVKDELEMFNRYDGKYWPSMSDFIRVISDEADEAIVEASDPTTADATRGARGSNTDFFRAFFGRLEDEAESHRFNFPRTLKLKDATIAALATCALNLGPEEMFTSEYIKQLRQRLRDEAKADAS